LSLRCRLEQVLWYESLSTELITELALVSGTLCHPRCLNDSDSSREFRRQALVPPFPHYYPACEDCRDGVAPSPSVRWREAVGRAGVKVLVLNTGPWYRPGHQGETYSQVLEVLEVLRQSLLMVRPVLEQCIDRGIAVFFVTMPETATASKGRESSEDINNARAKNIVVKEVFGDLEVASSY
jgi:hypothetical protein